MAFVPSRTPVSAVQRLVDRLQPYREAQVETPTLAQLNEWLARVVGYPDAHAAQVAARKALLVRQALPLLPTVSPRRLKEWAVQARKAWPAASAEALWAAMWGHASWDRLVERLNAAQEAPSGYVVAAAHDRPLPDVYWVGQAVDGRWWGLERSRVGCHVALLGSPIQCQRLAPTWWAQALAEGQCVWWWGQSPERAQAARAIVSQHDPARPIWWANASQKKHSPQPSLAGWTRANVFHFQMQLLRPWWSVDLDEDQAAFVWNLLMQYAQAVADALTQPGMTMDLGTLADLWLSPQERTWDRVPEAIRAAAREATQAGGQCWWKTFDAAGVHWQTLAAWFDRSQTLSLPPSGAHAFWVGPAGDTTEAQAVRHLLMEWAWPERMARLGITVETPNVRPASLPSEWWWMEGRAMDDWLGSLVPVRLAQARAMRVSLVWATTDTFVHQQLSRQDKRACLANLTTCVRWETVPHAPGEADLIIQGAPLRLVNMGPPPRA